MSTRRCTRVDYVWRIARALALVALTAGVIVALRAVNWPRTAEALRAANGTWLLAAVMANAAILIPWSMFWRLARPRSEPFVSRGRMLEIVSSASAMMNTLPFGGGHAAAIVLLVRRAQMTKRGALSLMALDQLGEGLVKATIFLLVGILVPLPAWTRVAITTATLGVAAWLVVVMVSSRWVAELRMFGEPRRAIAAFASVASMKVAQLVAIIAVQRAYGVSLSPGESLLVLAVILLASMITVAPGNLGTYEAGAFLVYRYLGLSPEQALSLAIVQHLCFMLPSVGIGYLVFSAQTFSRNAIASR